MIWKANPMIPAFYITDTGFGFTSGQYVLQPYAGGIIDFNFTAADFLVIPFTRDIFTDAGAGERTIKEDQLNAADNAAADAISAEEYAAFTKTADAVDAEGLWQLDDFAQTMNQDFTGTWLIREMGEAIRLTTEGA